MYHFFSATGAAGVGAGDSLPVSSPTGGAAASGDTSSSGAAAYALSTVLPIDQLREVRPDHVEQAEDDRGDDRHDDHDHGGCADFLGSRPRNLLQLARDFIGEPVILVAAVHRDARDDRDDTRDQRDAEFTRQRLRREIAPDPI